MVTLRWPLVVTAHIVYKMYPSARVPFPKKLLGVATAVAAWGIVQNGGGVVARRLPPFVLVVITREEEAAKVTRGEDDYGYFQRRSQQCPQKTFSDDDGVRGWLRERPKKLRRRGNVGYDNEGDSSETPLRLRETQQRKLDEGEEGA
ncbi:hypothetical protein VNO77_22116 [Canavalia gladiata]|uniref:Uncharacterized protein n=1 Tax=Canavalia gladiata TaxID=3824 RepID=A0AAN9QAH6_CANGL